MTVVKSGHTFIVSTGIVNGLIVLAGGTAIVDSYAATSGTVLKGGAENVGNAGSAFDTTVWGGGVLSIEDGAKGRNARIGPHGSEVVSGFSAIDYHARIEGAGAVQYVDTSYAATAVVASGGTQIVSAFGDAIASDIRAGGTQILTDYSRASDQGKYDTTIDSGGKQIVSDGSEASYSYLLSGGEQILSNGGYSYATQNEGGKDFVLSGGFTLTGTLLAGAVETVYNGGSTTSSLIVSGGEQIVSSGGVASQTYVEGGAMLVKDGGTALDPILGLAPESGDSFTPGTLELASPGSAIMGSVTFTTPGDTLQIDTRAMPTALIAGFAAGDTILLQAVAYSTHDTISVNGNSVAIDTPSGTFVLDIAGAANDTFMLGDSGGATSLGIAAMTALDGWAPVGATAITPGAAGGIGMTPMAEASLPGDALIGKSG